MSEQPGYRPDFLQRHGLMDMADVIEWLWEHDPPPGVADPLIWHRKDALFALSGQCYPAVAKEAHRRYMSRIRVVSAWADYFREAEPALQQGLGFGTVGFRCARCGSSFTESMRQLHFLVPRGRPDATEPCEPLCRRCRAERKPGS